MSRSNQPKQSSSGPSLADLEAKFGPELSVLKDKKRERVLLMLAHNGKWGPLERRYNWAKGYCSGAINSIIDRFGTESPLATALLAIKDGYDSLNETARCAKCPLRGHDTKDCTLGTIDDYAGIRR